LSEEYCLLSERRLELAEEDTRIQGFDDGVFWERNSQPKPQRQPETRGEFDFG
jgi:site-specific DNA-methyltransferase (adenine-specific)